MDTTAVRSAPTRGVAQPEQPRENRTMLRNALLACGILSSLHYVSMLVVVPAFWDGYSSASQTVSELSAIGAPTRALWVSLGFVWSLLYIAFGWGIWLSGGSRRALRVVGGAIMTAGFIGLFWPPMHQRDVLAMGGGTLTDTLHIVWTIINGTLTLLAMGAGATVFDKRFRLYSIVSIVILIAAGAMASAEASGVQANLSTPWIGVWERVNMGAWLLWIVMLATVLLRQTGAAAEPSLPEVGRPRSTMSSGSSTTR